MVVISRVHNRYLFVQVFSRKEDVMNQKAGPQTAEIQDKDIEFVGGVEGIDTVYIDGMQGISVINGVARIGLFEIVQDPTAGDDGHPMRKVFVGRVAIPAAALMGVSNWLRDRAIDYEKAEVVLKSG